MRKARPCELRAEGQRTGFELVTLAGERALLATKDREATLARTVPFGRYRVTMEAIEAVDVPALLDALERGQAAVDAVSAPRSGRWRSCRRGFATRHRDVGRPSGGKRLNH